MPAKPKMYTISTPTYYRRQPTLTGKGHWQCLHENGYWYGLTHEQQHLVAELDAMEARDQTSD